MKKPDIVVVDTHRQIRIIALTREVEIQGLVHGNACFGVREQRCRLCLRLFLENGFKDSPEPRFILYDFSQLLQGGFIGRAGNQKMEVAALGVFLVKVFQCAVPVAFLVQFGVVGEAELDSPSDDGLGND